MFLHRQGTTLVEMALTLPILFLFVFAAVEFGRANMIRHFAQNAAYEGARAGIVPGATTAIVQTAAQNILQISGVQDGTVTVTPAVLGPNDTEITIDVSVPFDTNSFFVPLFLAGRNLQTTCTLSTEVTGL